VATTSSAEKAEVLKKLGADHTIIYKDDKNWGKTARALTTDQAGFEHIIEVGGAETMSQSLDAVKLEGTITFIGLVTGIDPPDSMGETLKRVCTIRGIHVGSRAMMEDMMAGMEANSIQPVLDPKVFKLEELKEALTYLVSYFPHSSHGECDLRVIRKHKSTSGRSQYR
jgi:NADPH:quinone reductase-like Zn-dependent oxidoreductase